MIKKSWLTTVIGFLIGCLIYLTIESSTLIVFITGGAGYFLGLILDDADIKHQMETFHFTSITPTQQYFQANDIPEALIIYSLKENVTSVMIDFKVEMKPQNFRFSVLKNLQDFEFRVIEDANKTMFSLSLEYPECNYPDLLATNQIDNIHFDIQERSHDFQGALQKIVPGLVLSPIHYPDLFGDELDQSLQQPIIVSPPKPPSPPSSSNINPDYTELKVDNSIENQDLNDFDEKTISQALIDYPSRQLKNESNYKLMTSLNSSENKQNSNLIFKKDTIHNKSNINESEIMKDLLEPSQSINNTQSESEIPNLSPEAVQELKDINTK
ncbi:MAG: hypothetical protein ACFE8U_10090, partial [Candidatus Hermodarchaeota archaeon]